MLDVQNVTTSEFLYIIALAASRLSVSTRILPKPRSCKRIKPSKMPHNSASKMKQFFKNLLNPKILTFTVFRYTPCRCRTTFKFIRSICIQACPITIQCGRDDLICDLTDDSLLREIYCFAQLTDVLMNSLAFQVVPWKMKKIRFFQMYHAIIPNKLFQFTSLTCQS